MQQQQKQKKRQEKEKKKKSSVIGIFQIPSFKALEKTEAHLEKISVTVTKCTYSIAGLTRPQAHGSQPQYGSRDAIQDLYATRHEGNLNFHFHSLSKVMILKNPG